jgi:hypothetical protein
MPLTFSPEEEAERRILFTPCKTKEEVHDWVQYYLGLDLPGSQVDEASNCSPLDMVWECYSHQIYGPENEEVSRILYYACRFGGKSLSESIIEVLLLFHARNDIFHLAAIKEQSYTVQKYIKKFLYRPLLRDFVGNDSKGITTIIFYEPTDPNGLNLSESEFKKLEKEEKTSYKFVANSVEVIVATMESCNSKHGMLVLDEIDVMLGDAAKAAYFQAMNIPSPSRSKEGERRLPLTILTSTRKTSFGLVQHELDEAAGTGLVVRHWNVLDIMEACPTSRHLPLEPKVTIYRSDETLAAVSEDNYKSLPVKEQEKYVKDTGYAGCLSRCKLFGVCKGRLATKQTSNSEFLQSIADVQNKIREQPLPQVKAELLCLKPSTTGLVYPRFDPEKHVITPAEAYRRIMGAEWPNGPHMTKRELIAVMKSRELPCYGGMDFGYSHLFAYVQGFKDVNRFFVTNAIAMPELEKDQQVEVMEQFKADRPTIFADTEDPGGVQIFRNKGFKLPKWIKGKGSVPGGIACVQMKLTPSLGAEPELFIVRDIGEDPGIDLLIKYVREHHWKLDAANNPTDLISDDNKDLPDALRYTIMNVFPFKGKYENIINSHSFEPPPRVPMTDSGVQYGVETWMAQKIAEETGMPFVPRQGPRQIKITSLSGQSLVFEGSGRFDKAEPEVDQRGKCQDVLWDMS